MPKITLIGNGFVGKTLKKVFEIDETYTSKNIDFLSEKDREIIFCAAPSGKKWLANKNPLQDAESCNLLCKNIVKTNFQKIVLFSTIDVFQNPIVGNDEFSDKFSNEPYGANRRAIETVVSNMPNHRIIRLPGLFGEYMEKNYIFDLKTQNNLENVKTQTFFQWLYLEKIRNYIEMMETEDIKILNLATEPIKTEEIIDIFFKESKTKLDNISIGSAYDMRSIHFPGGYLAKKEEILKDLSVFLGRTEKI